MDQELDDWIDDQIPSTPTETTFELDIDDEEMISLDCKLSLQTLETPCLPVECIGRHYWSTVSTNHLEEYWLTASNQRQTRRCLNPSCGQMIPNETGPCAACRMMYNKEKIKVRPCKCPICDSLLSSTDVYVHEDIFALIKSYEEERTKKDKTKLNYLKNKLYYNQISHTVCMIPAWGEKEKQDESNKLSKMPKVIARDVFVRTPEQMRIRVPSLVPYWQTNSFNFTKNTFPPPLVPPTAPTTSTSTGFYTSYPPYAPPPSRIPQKRKYAVSEDKKRVRRMRKSITEHIKKTTAYLPSPNIESMLDLHAQNPVLFKELESFWIDALRRFDEQFKKHC
jgi:hypothetical protein